MFLLTNPLLLPFGHLLFILLSLLVYAITSHISHTRRHPSAAFAWVLLLVLLPYIGLPIYLLVGLRKYARPLSRRRRPTASPTGPSQPGDMVCHWATATLAGLGMAPPQHNQSVVLHQDGPHALRELERVIESAQRRLDLCTYVLGNDPVSHHLMQLLSQAVQRGVQVRLLIDAVGSWRTSWRMLRRLRQAGLQVRCFMPLLHNPMRGRINLRNHRKLVVADGQRLWTGGRNLAQLYFLPYRKQPGWIDLTVTIEGALAQQAQQLFNACWRRHRGHSMSLRRPLNTHSVATAPSATPESSDLPHCTQLIPSGPDLADDTVLSLLLTGLYQARQSVWAITPYFVPDESLLTALRLAAIRGVDVNLLIPRRSNHWLADIVRQQPLRDLAAAGGKIWLVDHMMHAKVVLIDDSLALTGSLNLDARSLFLNFELMVAFYSQQDISALQAWVAQLAGQAHPYTPPTQTSFLRDIGEGMVRWLGFQI